MSRIKDKMIPNLKTKKIDFVSIVDIENTSEVSVDINIDSLSQIAYLTVLKKVELEGVVTWVGFKEHELTMNATMTEASVKISSIGEYKILY